MPFPFLSLLRIRQHRFKLDPVLLEEAREEQSNERRAYLILMSIG